MPHEGKYTPELIEIPETSHLDIDSSGQNPSLPSPDELNRRLKELDDSYIYGRGDSIPDRFLERAVVCAGLVAQGADSPSLQRAITHDTILASRHHKEAYQGIIPHRDWGGTTLLEIIVEDKVLKPVKLRGTNLDTNETVEYPESETALEARRNSRETSLKYGLDFVRREALLSALKQGISGDSSIFGSIASNELTNSNKTSPIGLAIQQAQDSFHKATKGDVGQQEKERLLNASFDASFIIIEKLSKSPSSPEKAHAYLIAAQSIHDLAIRPGSFERHMPEAEAREFRVRALEMASAWVDESLTLYRESFGKPIGAITEDSFKRIQIEMQECEKHAKTIHDVRWFKEIYSEEYKKAAQALEKLNKTRRIIAERAVVFYLNPDLSPNVPAPPPLGVGIE